MNKTILIGRLTNDPETKTINEKGTKVVRFNIAVNRNFKNQNGEIETDFFPVVAWEKLGENIAKYVKKGDQVALEGRIQNRNYVNNDGIKKYVTEIIAENVTFLSKVNKTDGE